MAVVDYAAVCAERPVRRTARSTGRDIWAVADQGLISATNFATMILVARGLGGPAEFGTFTLVYSALLFANMLQIALVTQPHNVLGTARRGHDYIRYTSSTAVAQLVLVLIEGAIALLAAGVAWRTGWRGTSLLVALVPSIIAWQLQEFVRRVLYTEGRHRAAFVNDLISYGGQTLVIGVLWLSDTRAGGASVGRWLTGASALYALAGTSAAAFALGVWQIRASLSRSWSSAAIAENWRFGKWLAGAEILTWCSSIHMYLYLAAAVLGTAATGELKAAQILFGPMRVAAYYLDTVLPIRFARTRKEAGDPAMTRRLRKVLMKVVPTLAAYCLVVALLPGTLLKLTFGRGYSGAATVLALYSGYAFLTYLQMVVAAALKAKHLTHSIFAGSVCGAMIAMLISVPLMFRLGTSGVLIGMIAAAAVVTLLYVAALHQSMTRDRTGTVALLAAKEEPCPS